MIRLRLPLKFKALLGLLLFSLQWVGEQAWALEFAEVKAGWVESDSTLLDRSGLPIQVLRSNSKIRQLAWTELKDISPSLIQAVLASEDRRFYLHHGIDWFAVAESTKRRLLNEPTRGASTISMQVTAFLNSSLRPKGKRHHRTWNQKWDQAREAWELEKHWSKDQILETYLNTVDFRGELRGISAAARGLYGKVPSGLNREESLVIASLIRSPETRTDKLRERACALGHALASVYDCSLLSSALLDLRPHFIVSDVNLAPHVGRKLLTKGKNRTTLDRALQARVIEVLRQNVLSHKSNNMNDAAALVVENRSGRVLAYVGSVGDLSQSAQVDGVQAKRQAGSTLKPFLYELAIEGRYLTASSSLNDSAADIALGDGAVYHPRDFDHEFHGESVTLAQSLGSSLNVPAVRTLKMIGVSQLVERLKKLGFRDLRGEEFYGPSLALGSADVTLWDLVNGYRTLANLGVWSEMSYAESQANERSRRVMPESSAFIINEILADADNRSLTFGLDSPLSLPFWAAVKTGTSKDMRDNWCIGFTKNYTVGVWAGNFSGKPMWNVSGVTGAAPAWAQIIESLPHPRSNKNAVPPKGVIRLGDSWYLNGTQPEVGSFVSTTKAVAKVSHFQITYPVEGMLISPDPDIPLAQQRVFFEVNSPKGLFQKEKLKWILNDKEIQDIKGEYSAQLVTAGSYDLKLLSEDGAVLDEVHFLVRGRL